MIQALIVTNPKWERFSTVSDKFKALKDSAVLVVRGRNKEKRIKGEVKLVKKDAETAEALAADLRKAGKNSKEIEKAVESFAGKVSKTAKTAAAVIAGLFLTATAFAQADITANLPVALQEPATTNGVGAGVIGWNYQKVAVLQIAATSTNVAHATTRSNVVVRFDTSLNGTDWQTNVYAISVAPSLTASQYNNTIGTITNIGSKYLRIGRVENPNTNRVWLARFYLSID